MVVMVLPGEWWFRSFGKVSLPVGTRGILLRAAPLLPAFRAGMPFDVVFGKTALFLDGRLVRGMLP